MGGRERKRQESNLPETPSRLPTVLKTARPTGDDTLPGSACLRSGNQLAAGQHDASIADAPGGPHPIKIFENIDRQVAADARAILEHLRGKGAFGRGLDQLNGDFGEPRQGFGKKVAIVCDLGDATQAFGAVRQPPTTPSAAPRRRTIPLAPPSPISALPLNDKGYLLPDFYSGPIGPAGRSSVRDFRSGTSKVTRRLLGKADI
jgi:hypothetical protein